MITTFPESAIWSTSRRGNPRLVIMSWILFVIFVGLMTLGVYLLDLEQRWYYGLAAGLFIGSIIPANYQWWPRGDYRRRHAVVWLRTTSALPQPATQIRAGSHPGTSRHATGYWCDV